MENLKIYSGDVKKQFQISRLLKSYNMKEEDIDFVLDEFIKIHRANERANEIFKKFTDFYNEIVNK